MRAKRWVWIAVGLIAAVAVTACTAQLSGGDQETITVTGYGEARGNPDMATVNVGVNVINSSIDAAVEESNETIARITAALKSMGIEEADIQTTNFSVWQEDVYAPETGQPTGEKRYRVDSTVQINVLDVSRASEALKVAIENGANNIYGLSFGIDDTDPLAAQARAAAIADARARAEQVAAGFGVSLGVVTSVTEVSGGPVFAYFDGKGGGGGGGGGPPISQGSLTVSASVSVSFAIVR